MSGYRLGAVVYHPNVRRIWEDFGAWFSEHGLPLEPRYYDRYEEQVADLLAGELETAWNTNLAHVQVLQATHGTADALAMRDTDRGWRSVLVALADSGFSGLDDVRGRCVGFGDADSPQAHILPVHALREAGFDPDRDCSRPGWTATWASMATPAAPSSRSSRACGRGSSTRASCRA